MKQPRPLTPAEFQPLAPGGARRSLRISPLYLGVAVIGIIAVAVFVYLMVARAVIFKLDPPNAELSLSGLSFHIGENFLLLPGTHGIEARAEGYYPLATEIEVTDERTQEAELSLEPLPGNLQVQSELDDIEVFVGEQLAGTAPGLIEGIPKGSHIIEFSKYRYFPLRQEIEIEGLGRTQSVMVDLEPAWGHMQINSVPVDAEVFVDGRSVGVTPITAEVLETGTVVTLNKNGYKTWERELTVPAGTRATYPPIELVVADGTVEVTSSPSGAHVSVDGEFRGRTPVTVDISPLSAHRIELFLEGYQKASRSVETEPEAHSTLALDLVPVIGRIQLSVSPADAEVLVNGRAMGTGSQTLALTARKHELTVRKPGFEARVQEIRPRPDEDQSLDIRLLTLEQAYWASRPPTVQASIGQQLKLFRPSASFTMGAARREPGRRANEAQRNVRLERPFYIATHEVTNAQYKLFRSEHNSTAVRGETLSMGDQPVVGVTWNDAALFCNWLSRRDGLPEFYIESGGQVRSWNIDSHGYRLPTEAEWAFVARVDSDGSELMFPWGTQVYPPPSVIANYADQGAAEIVSFTLTNYDDGFPTTSPVGSFPPNINGLYDISGNVSEWINDFFEIRPNSGEPLLDPTGPETGDRHVIRGASWARAARSELRLAYRNAGQDGNLETGFRIARYVDRSDAHTGETP